MSDRGNAVEWVETTEEVIVTEECLPHGGNTSAVIPVFESSETPIQKLLDTMVQGEDPEFDGFYCEECRSLFQDQSEVNGINGPSFILDSPTTMGVSQRALLTLPHGLMIGRSSIPTAGLGVINQGPTVSPGMHFGPYEGDVTTRDSAVASDFSWEIYKAKDEFEYIDAARETHSNWMRYVNCARNEDEKNLLAVQYKDSVLFHCCRNIHPGDELMVWPSSKLLSQLSEAWTQIWLMKFTPTESNTTVASQIFLCCHCQLSFTTEAYLQRHTDYFHLHHKDDCTAAGLETVDASCPSSSAEAEHLTTSVVVMTMDPLESKTCADCGKSFKHAHHLRRHRLCVHANKRPYCCPQCRRTFSQASGLIRHQLVHRKQSLVKRGNSGSSQSDMLGEAEILPPTSEINNNVRLIEAEEVNEIPEVNTSDKLTATQVRPLVEDHSAQVGANEAVDTCSECNKSFFNESALKKHRLTVHSHLHLRPYVCSLCRKCFGQKHDLDRHLKCHQRRKTEENNSEMPPVDDQNKSANEGAEDQPNETTAQCAATETTQCIQTPLYQRPQRLGVRSKISAITKLIAPKRRAQVAKKTVPSPVKSKEACVEPQPADTDVSPPENDGVSEPPHRCKRCKVACESPEDLRAHECITGQHKCTQCGATFRKPGFLKRHERMVHLNAKSYICERCSKAFSKLSNLKQHQKSKRCEKHHCTSELFPCSFCQFSFTMKSYLLKHIRRHHSAEYIAQRESDNQMILLEEEVRGKPQVCPHCSKIYVDENHFRSHVCFQQVKIVYLCTDCGKGFPYHYALKQHQRVHTGEKPYSCSHCEKSFAHAGQLTVHLRTHTGEKPYLCTHCGESFRQSGDLKRHEAKHTGVRPHHCPECFKSFSRPQSLKAHQLLHMGQRLFKCTQCGKSFSRNYHLRRHHQKMHS